MMQALQRWYSRMRGNGTRGDLPAELVAALAGNSFALIQNRVQTLLQVRPDALDRLLQEAGGRNWPYLELAKLAAFGHFYQGDLGAAFARAAPYCGGLGNESFDADLFMVALLSLYHNNQFEDARRLLSGLGKREGDCFYNRADYFSIKSSVALANNLLMDAWIAIQEARRLQPEDAAIALNAYALAFRVPDMASYAQLRDDIAAGRYAGDLNAFALATPVLAQDDYPEGFRLLERRYYQPDARRYINPALPLERIWSGRASAWPHGKTLLLSCEQGAGDTIQMARYFPALAALTEGHLVIETPPEVLPLLEHVFPTIRFVPRRHGVRPAEAFDCWTGSLSLPFIFGSTATDIPGKSGYLSVAEENRGYWRARLNEFGERKPRIGLAWAGNPAHSADRQRSIAFENFAAHLRAWPSLDFFALQICVPPARPENLRDLSSELLTFADTAALVEQMDLVITVDTSVVHLAGALGKETWLLLPRRYEWRWSLEGEENRWYDSVRVIRQSRHGDWTAVLEEIFGSRLAAWLSRWPC